MRDKLVLLKDLAHKLRIHSIEMTDQTASGHPTSCSSMAEIMSVLFFDIMKYKVKEPLHPSNDRFILSKGHAAPILYAAWAEAGLFPEEKLKSLRLITSDLEGHPTPRLNFIDVATGSLGQGLSVGAGMAYDALYIDRSSFMVYCLLGDGESMEGSVWEAAAFAGYYKLRNLVAIVDVNELGQSDYTSLKYNMEAYKFRFDSHGFHSIIVDGHDIQALLKAFSEAKTQSKPTVILAKTKKGAYFPNIESKLNWHGKSLGKESKTAIDHLKSLMSNPSINGTDLLSSKNEPTPDLQVIASYSAIKMNPEPNYELGKDFATRAAGGSALAKLGACNDRIVVCDADVKNSTFTDKFKSAYPNRFVDCFIAEQNLVGVATGLACRNRHVVFISTFGAFLSRAHDQLRMGAISMSKIKVLGTHCGVSIGEDGGSQMALEDIAMFRSLPDCVVLYPSDAVSAERAVELAATTPKMFYLRMSRPALPTIYKPDEIFEIGKSKICLKSDSDKILVVGACVTLFEALKAAETLKKSGINVRIMDIFSVKPIDKDGLVKNASECHNRILTVEDHYLEGGIGEAVASAVGELGKFKVHSICVNSLPRSGKPAELIDMFGLSSSKIADRIKAILN